MACDSMTIWLERANIAEVVARLPESQGETLVTDLSYITRVVLKVGDYEVDSDVAPTAIWWTDVETRTVTVDGTDESFTGDVLKFQVGPEFATAGLTAGEYEDCRIVVYDLDHTEGSVLTDDLFVTVLAAL